MVISNCLLDRKLTQLKPQELYKLFGNVSCPLTDICTLDCFETLLLQHLHDAYGILNKNRINNFVLTRMLFNTFHKDSAPKGMMHDAP